jgi:hypothetical protein
LDRSWIDLCDRRLIDPGGIMERLDQGSPLPSDPAGREDVIREDVTRDDHIRAAEQPGDAAADG